MTGQTVLEFRNVLKQYPGADGVPFTALDLDSLALEKGAFAAVIGPSGSGKTTFLNLASGLDRPDRGEIRVGGHAISELSQTELCRFRRDHVGFVFQSYNLFPVLSAVENVEFTSIIRGDDSKMARERALRALEVVGLAHKARSRPGQLSGGQQQRVAVARALATEPEIIFADEPTANLDSKTALALIELFEELNRKFSTTFLFSTHDNKLVDRVRTRIEMRDGKLRS